MEKSNKDEIFRYHIAKVEEDDFSLQDEPVLTDEDVVLGIRPEFVEITPVGRPGRGDLRAPCPPVWSPPSKCAWTASLLTGGGVWKHPVLLGAKVRVSISSENIMLFDRRSGRCIAQGSLQFC